MTEPSKACFKCRETKPLSEFYKHRMMGDGHLGKCKACTRADVRDNRAAKLDYYRAYDRIRYVDHGPRGAPSPTTAESKRRYRQSNPEKRRAHERLGNAVNGGRLAKPTACSRCGAGGRIHGHHHDYAKPLEVEWLCVKCHADEHRRHDYDADRRLLLARPTRPEVP